MDNKKQETMDEYLAKKVPALRTTHYEKVAVEVPDKFGIVRAAQEFLAALHNADMQDLDDDQEAVVNNINVQSAWSDLQSAYEGLAGDMETEQNQDLNADTVENDIEYFTNVEIVYSVENGYKAEFYRENAVSYLIGLVDDFGSWYTFTPYEGLTKATSEDIENIKFNANEFNEVADENGDAYGGILDDTGTKIVYKKLLVFHKIDGTAYKFNEHDGLVAMPENDTEPFLYDFKTVLV